MSETEYFEALPEALKPFARAGEDGDIKPLSQLEADISGAFQWQGNSLRMPGPDAGDEDIGKFQDQVMQKIPGLMKTPNLEDTEGMDAMFAKLGKPDAADAYKTPDGVDLTPEQVGQIKGLAFKANMTQAQFNNYLTEWGGAYQQEVHAASSKHEEAITALRGEWGAAYDQNVGEITAFLKTNATTPDSVVAALEGGQLPAEQVRWLHSLASTVSNEDGEFHKQENPGERKLTPSEAEAQLVEIRNRLYTNDGSVTHQEKEVLNKKRLELMAYMHPDS